ncbi:Aminopeptidase [Labilithrix luteola]|uniref:Aminopeptidase N n=1 Tax=Labilithrix luteola TaxID=1391654 RepID=A0A0K1PVI6_9BACT|nr:Aminopeptidase [Labilithrix luteola]
MWLVAASCGCSGSGGQSQRPLRETPKTTATAQSPGLEECREAAGAIDVVHHDIRLTIHRAPSSLHGEGTIHVRARRPTPIVVLDIRALRIASVRSNSQPLGIRVADGHLCMKLPSPLPALAEAPIEAAWDVEGHDTLHVAEDQVWAGYDASAWMPTLRDASQRATLTVRIDAPPEWKVTASGHASPSAQALGGRASSTFELKRSSPPFLYAFAAGHFDEAELDVDGVRLRAWGPPGEDLRGALATTASTLRFFQKTIGVPLPADEYRQVFVRDNAAQEAAGFSLLGAKALADLRRTPREDWIFSHELAHQWFGWLVPCVDFRDFWLNEGFATFMVAAAKERRWGRDEYDREVALWRKRSAKVHEDGHDAPISLAPPGLPRRSIDDSELQARGVTYARGALVLHKLRTELGDEVFWRAIHRYVEQRADHGATTEDLRAAFDDASGRDMRPFFATWVYTNAPDL